MMLFAFMSGQRISLEEGKVDGFSLPTIMNDILRMQLRQSF